MAGRSPQGQALVSVIACKEGGAQPQAAAQARQAALAARRLHGLVYSIQSSEAPPVAQNVSTVTSIKKYITGGSHISRRGLRGRRHDGRCVP